MLLDFIHQDQMARKVSRSRDTIVYPGSVWALRVRDDGKLMLLLELDEDEQDDDDEQTHDTLLKFARILDCTGVDCMGITHRACGTVRFRLTAEAVAVAAARVRTREQHAGGNQLWDGVQSRARHERLLAA